MRIERIDEKLENIKKPVLCAWKTKKVDKEDVFIICAGFEIERVVEILKRIISDKSNSGFKVLIIKYLPEIEHNKLGEREIEKLCEQEKLTPTYITFDREEPSGIGFQILNNIKETKGRILIDISAMSRILIVQIIVAIGKSSLGFKNTEVLYTEALKYPPAKKNVEEVIKNERNDILYRTMFLSMGVMGVAIIPELSSVAFQGQPIRLVVFPSFNIDQLPVLSGELQPSYINFIHGIPPLSEYAWRPEAIKRLNHIEKILNREETSTSTLDYRETLKCLLQIYKDYGVKDRIIIAPTGSKMQSVAVGIFRTFMDDVQIVYPTPLDFAPPKEYTEGVREAYSLSLDKFLFWE